MKSNILLSFFIVTLCHFCYAQEKPNVLFISVDDLNDFPSYANRYEGAITPNLDKLANQGTVFNNAYCQYSVCGPSRASVMSGFYPHNLSGSLNEDDVVQESTKALGSELMHTWFRNNGYETLAVGKILHGHLPEGTLDETGGRGSFSSGLGKLQRNWHQNGTMTDWAKDPETDEQMPDHQAANWAADQLSKKHDKPFFLMVGFLRPHNPWYVPKKWWDMYDREKIKLPEYKKDDLEDIPKLGLKNIKNQMPRTEWAIETDQWRDIVHSYLASITFVDHQIGKVIKALEESEYSKNTIIVLWSDHGYQMGEKNTFQKATLWERSTHVPLLFAGPEVPKGKSSDRVVSLLDIYPTLLEMSGLPKNSKNEGRSLVPLIKNPSTAWSYPSVTGYNKDCYAIQNERYRYIRYADGGEELYDHQNDPNEWTNLAGNLNMNKIKADLAKYIPNKSQDN
ncbi:arylsulfatase A-like enzyme [Mariniflexile fucanivorans]|uniref:Arylsulfatase A-like enzyme n=1 Tax=Mariniflexile fucanivorans TaxID=264023 RepID=A0A4R1RL24_9FLAO|nr:sulfatase [Mariniflexile fucanivorans]TCL66905.1 arylsulfatase A-like enzyme [Mariniflexile fucanivorans]